jgi:hypothetical protein
MSLAVSARQLSSAQTHLAGLLHKDNTALSGLRNPQMPCVRHPATAGPGAIPPRLGKRKLGLR